MIMFLKGFFVVAQGVWIDLRDRRMILVFEERCISFERYVERNGGVVHETLQIVYNTIKSGELKRTMFWREERPTPENGYENFVIPY